MPREKRPSKPKTTIYLDQEDFDYLKAWADLEFRTIPQLVGLMVRRSINERKKNNPNPSD